MACMWSWRLLVSAPSSLLFRPFSVSQPTLARRRRRFIAEGDGEPAPRFDLEAIEDFLSESGTSPKQVREASDAMLLRDFQRHQAQLKQKIMERKHFKKPQEINLLTWEAKEQIRYLNREFPDEWTPEALAESFPVSREGIFRILKGSFKPRTEKEILKHDHRVASHWKHLKNLLAAKGSPVDSASFHHVLDTGKLPLMINAGGVPHLPKPKKSEQGSERSDQLRSRKIGIFESIVAGSNHTQAQVVLPKIENRKTENEGQNTELLAEIAATGKYRLK